MVNVTVNTQILLGIVLGLYLVGLLVLSIVANRKVQNEEDYLVAGRRLPLYLAFGTLIATWFGAATMMGAAEEARADGLSGQITLDPFACSFTLILSGLFFAKRLWRMKLFTMGDFYRRAYGTRAEFVGCVIQTVGYFGWVAAQYVALAGVLETYFGLDPWIGILITAAVTLFYTTIGGMWSVTLTDTAQIGIAFIGLIVLGVTAFGHLGNGSVLAGIDRMLSQLPEDHLRMVPRANYLPWIGLWLTGLFGNIPGQDLQQRVFAAKDEKTASRACISAGVVYLCFGMIPVSLGMASNLLVNPEEVQGKLLPALAKAFLSPTMAVVFTLAVVSIIVSTATSAVLAPATILGHNIFGRLPIARRRPLLVNRACVLLVGCGGIALAMTGDRILGLLEFSLDMALVGLFVPLVFGMFGKPRGELPGLLAMIFGAGTWMLLFFLEVGWEWTITLPLFGAEETLPPGIAGLIASSVGYLLGQFVNRMRGLPWVPRDFEAAETLAH